jgi:hypothetical protein
VPSETLIRGPTTARPGAMPGQLRAAGLHTWMRGNGPTAEAGAGTNDVGAR